MNIFEISVFGFSIEFWTDQAKRQYGDARVFADTHSMNYGVDFYLDRLVITICTPIQRKDR